MGGRSATVGAGLAAVLMSSVMALAGATAAAADEVGSSSFAATGLASVQLPVATIGEFDCAALDVEISLDNSRSTEAVTYGYRASWQRPRHAPHSGADDAGQVEVGARATRVVRLGLRDDSRTTVVVRLPDGGEIHRVDSCGDAPAARFGFQDCDTSRLGLSLDNGDSTRGTRYRWTVRDLAGSLGSRTLVVAAGETEQVFVPLPEGNRVRAEASVDGQGVVATSDWRGCGPHVVSPKASFGPVRCTDLTAVLTLDNTRSSARLRFRVPAHADVVLDGGSSRTFRMRLARSDRLTVTADGVLADGLPGELAVVRTSRCPRQAAASGGTGGAGNGNGGSAQVRETPPTSGPVGALSSTGGGGRVPWGLAAATGAGLLGLGLFVAARRRPRRP
jgi:hypothetical protein